MVADAPVGAFLSGGLDSSAIVSFARKKNKNIRCFTIEVKGGQEKGIVDDLYYADPLFFFDYCKNYFSEKITLIHDYDLYEFTILVKKE